MKQVKDFFTTNDKLYVSSSFSERFGEESLGETSGALQYFTLEIDRSDEGILDMIGHRLCTFADIAQAITEEKQLLNNGYSNIFYVKKNDTVCAVFVYWYSDGREWRVGDWDLDGDDQWNAGRQVLFPGNAQTLKPSENRPSDTVTLSIDEIVINGVKYIKA